MRPLELRLTAFRSYDAATIDLRPHELVVITGDTGAGKTSLLDAISFAIFGRTPEQSTPTDLLTLGRDNGEVQLTFAARGQVWRMTRRYGARAPDPRQILERLADDGGDALETVAGQDAVAARLSAVIGMGFKAFTSAVLLAQGRFAEFLTAAPRSRDDILRELFGVESLDGARTAAQAGEAAALAEAALREGDGARLAAHDASARTAVARAARGAATEHAELVRLRPLAERVAMYQSEAERLRKRENAAREAVAALPDAAAAAELGSAIVAARRAIEDAATERSRRSEDHAQAVGARDSARARHGGGASDLAVMRERAERVARLARELPQRESDLTERESRLTKGEADQRERTAAAAEASAQDERMSARGALIEAWRARGVEQAEAAATLGEAQEGLSGAQARLRIAEAAVAEAEAAHERARLHDLASTIRAGLQPGDTCPVCGSAVADHAPEPGDLAAAERSSADGRRALVEETGALATAVERVGAARAAAERAADGRAAAGALLAEAGIAEADAEVNDPQETADADRRRAAIEEMRAELGRQEAELASERARIDAERERIARDRTEHDDARAGLGLWADQREPVGALTQAIAELHAVEAAADAAADAATVAADAAAAAERALGDLERGPVAALRAAAARAAARGRLEPPADDATPEQLMAAATELRVVALDAAREHAARAADAAERAMEARGALAAAGGSLVGDEPDRLEQIIRRSREARDAARTRFAEIESLAGVARRLAEEAAAARARAQLSRQVALDLRANAFPRFLLERYRERLARGASTHLQELSGGAYRFCGVEPDPMAVVDTRRGERLRPAGTLSGGERFLASLALALGLGDVAAESSGRLDCLFLDEGFSTLDSESLEQALAGVERLAGDGRLVGVITHLPGVAERLGAAIHIAKDPAGVSSIGL